MVANHGLGIQVYHDRIRALHYRLMQIFPNESYGSYASLFGVALTANEITRDDYDEAREYYGKLWNYAGD